MPRSRARTRRRCGHGDRRAGARAGCLHLLCPRSLHQHIPRRAEDAGRNGSDAHWDVMVTDWNAGLEAHGFVPSSGPVHDELNDEDEGWPVVLGGSSAGPRATCGNFSDLDPRRRRLCVRRGTRRPAPPIASDKTPNSGLDSGSDAARRPGMTSYAKPPPPRAMTTANAAQARPSRASRSAAHKGHPHLSRCTTSVSLWPKPRLLSISTTSSGTSR